MNARNPNRMRASARQRIPRPHSAGEGDGNNLREFEDVYPKSGPESGSGHCNVPRKLESGRLSSYGMASPCGRYSILRVKPPGLEKASLAFSSGMVAGV